MSSDSVLTDDEVYRTQAITKVFDQVKSFNNDLKLKIAIDETINNKQQYWAFIDGINKYIDSQL